MKKTSKIILGILLLLILLIIIYFSKCDKNPNPNTPPGSTNTPSIDEVDYGDFIPDQYVLSFEDSILENGVMVPLDDASIDSLINLFTAQGDTILQRCMCNKMVLVAPIDTVSPQERHQKARAKLDPQGGGIKYGTSSLNYTLQFQPVTDSVQFNYDFGFQYVKNKAPLPGEKVVRVAIVDTGFDPSHGVLTSNVWTNLNEDGDGIDNDNNCIADDINGGDIPTHQATFNQSDGHGTAVAGKVMGALGGGYPADIKLQMMNVKFTHYDLATDRQIGNLFDAVCGMRYAISKDAAVITASFGLYQDSVSSLLEDVVLKAKKHNVTIIAASGNDSINIDSFPFYPASFAGMSRFENVISVGAVDDSNQLADFSNYGKNSVLLAAPGVNQNILPFANGLGTLTMDGTSIAVPIVASTVSIIKAHQPEISPTDLKLCLFKGVAADPLLLTKINKGVFNSDEALEACGITPH